MATGTTGRRYLIDVFDVQTFHPRRLKSKVGAAPNIAVEHTRRSLVLRPDGGLVGTTCQTVR